MAVLIFEVLLRYLLNSPTIWGHETSIFLCALSFIWGGLYCVSSDRHIRVVIIYDLLGGRAKMIMDAIIHFLCVISCLFFAWASWTMVEKSWWSPSGLMRLETTGSAWNPPTPALLKGIMLLVLVLMTLQFLLFLIRDLRQLAGSK
jgi:TRAP-type C4-dicarboxylate transport system permease small subunit